jgi:hypothetical protein
VQVAELERFRATEAGNLREATERLEAAQRQAEHLREQMARPLDAAARPQDQARLRELQARLRILFPLPNLVSAAGSGALRDGGCRRRPKFIAAR